MIHRRVYFQNEVYWLHGRDDEFFNLSPLHHYTEDGKITMATLNEISYAIVVGDEIIRHNKIIGSKSELIDYDLLTN